MEGGGREDSSWVGRRRTRKGIMGPGEVGVPEGSTWARPTSARTRDADLGGRAPKARRERDLESHSRPRRRSEEGCWGKVLRPQQPVRLPTPPS